MKPFQNIEAVSDTALKFQLFNKSNLMFVVKQLVDADAILEHHLESDDGIDCSELIESYHCTVLILTAIVCALKVDDMIPVHDKSECVPDDCPIDADSIYDITGLVYEILSPGYKIDLPGRHSSRVH